MNCAPLIEAHYTVNNDQIHHDQNEIYVYRGTTEPVIRGRNISNINRSYFSCAVSRWSDGSTHKALMMFSSNIDQTPNKY
jgi:hypothetical protein